MSSLLRVCLCVGVLSAAATSHVPANLKEGDVCDQADDTVWTCRQRSDCPTLQESLVQKTGKSDSCGSKGNDLLCCKSLKSASGNISKEMCRRYAESVFITEPNIFDESVNETFDSCAALRPLIETYYARPKQYPHMAVIGYGERGSVSWGCTGSLVSQRFVITSAVCANPVPHWGPARWVRLGDHNLSSAEDDYSAMVYEVVELVVHPDYKKLPARNGLDDIALLKLNTEVNMTEHVRPICLPTENEVRLDSDVYAIDWRRDGRNKTGEPVEYEMMMTNDTACREAQFEVKVNASARAASHRDASQLCATLQGYDGRICLDNTGAPLLVALRDPYCMYSLVGISSLDPRNCSPDTPGLYTRVSHYVPWIESVIWPQVASKH